MVEITEDVIDNLKDDPALTEIINRRVFWVKPPGETYTYPFLVVAETANTPMSYSDDTEYISQINISVDIFSVKTDFKDIKNAVVSAMTNSGFTRETSGADEYISEIKAYHKALNFSIEATE